MTAFVYALDPVTRQVLASLPCSCLPSVEGLAETDMGRRMKPHFVRANALSEWAADSAVFELRDL